MTVLSLLMAGCDFIPRRNVAKNAELLRALEVTLARLETQGLMDSSTANFVFLHRFGTSFGNSIVLDGNDTDGNPLSAAQMIAVCQLASNTIAAGRVKSCLQRNFTTDEDLRYSHAGIAYRLPGGRWQVRQSLRSSETGIHFQWFGSLEEFVDIALIESRVEVVVPTLDMQARLTDSILVRGAGSDLIHPNYNLVAGPFQTGQQMSNQFILELAAAALQDPALPITRANVQAYLRANGFRPSIIQLRGLRSLGRFDQYLPTVSHDEQPYIRRYETGEIITVLSVKKFLRQQGVVAQIFEVIP